MTIPPRLSDQQQFILAVLAGPSTETRPYMDVTALSRGVAREFDRLEDNTPDDVEDLPDDLRELRGNLKHKNSIAPQPDKIVSDSHMASFSRALARLDERGLVHRSRTRGGRGHQSKTTDVRATEHGQKAGEEIRRQHNDGRHSLQFNTEPWTDRD